MGLKAWASTVVRVRRTLILIALVTAFAGVGLLIDRPKGAILEWFAVPLLVVGGGLFTWVVWPSAKVPSEGPASLGTRLLRRLTFDGRLVRLFPVIGVALVLVDAAYNLALSATPGLGTEDTIVLLAAATLLGYGFVPARFARERDFTLLFFLWLNAILVVPLLLARLYYADFQRSVDVYSWVALAPQTSAVLNLVGVSNQLHPVSGSTAPGLTFTPEHMAIQVTVVITTACSGIYSFGIFAAAFVAFVLTEYQELSRRIWLLLGLGLLSAYLANVLRMAIIVLIGYYTDTAETDLQNMLIAHSYAGWLIFLAWIALFWAVVFRILSPSKTSLVRPGPKKRGVLCGVCGDTLTPALPGSRCVCGMFYHVACASTVGECLKCHRPMQARDPTVKFQDPERA